MRPLVRWTVGPVGDTGRAILGESVARFTEAYPEFDAVVCCNQVDPRDCGRLGVPVFEQRAEHAPLPVRGHDPSALDEAAGCGWKLCPPRLREGGYELFLDNDVVVTERLPQIGDWLAGGGGLIAEGLRRRRMYGVFDGMVPQGVHVCAGVFGLPPGFDFGAVIRERGKVLAAAGLTLGGFDEQGLTASAVTGLPHYRVIPLTTLHIAEDHVPFPDSPFPAYHFVGANRKPWHRGWKAYRLRTGVRWL